MSSKKNDQFFLDIITEFVEVLIHQIIYLRDVYPASIFVSRRKFNLPLQMSQHPWVNEYISKVVDSLKQHLTNPEADIDSVEIVVSSTCGQMERFRLEFGSLSMLNSTSSDRMQSDQFMVGLEMSLASLLLRLGQTIAGMSSSTGEREWWVELGTTEQGVLRLMEGEMWCKAEVERGGGHIVPVMATDTPVKLQLYVESNKN